MQVFRCSSCEGPVLKLDDFEPNLAIPRGRGVDVRPRHPDCEKAEKRVVLFDTDSPPTAIGEEGAQKGRRYVVTDQPEFIAGTMPKPNWHVIGVWLDPE